MLILGIDPGTQILGYSILDTDAPKPRIVVMDVLYLKRMPDFSQRIKTIFHNTLRLIDGFHPDFLAIEAPFFGKNVQSMLKLGRAQGVAIAAAILRELPYAEYEPAMIKQTVTGNGNASKDQVATLLQSILCFDDHPHYFDATDALAVAYTCHMQLSNPIAGVRQELGIKHKSGKSSKRQWADFVQHNPDIVQ
ncbi:MAG: crossover junction endodeoxyribonuclease RuvC [Bacteroidales bacterium]|nr:crossover junction endodeoxyribonuclease RuvC [Bacteroidales bacterium]